MSTTPSTPRLSEVARHLVIPDGIKTSVFHRVKPRLSAMGVGFDPWQEGASTVALGCRGDGKFAATVGGVVWSIPRQVGKTYSVGNLLIALAIEIPGIRIVWTSHHNRTTTNTFRSMQGMVRRKQIRPFMPPGGGIRTTNGEQEIRFANGSIIMFGAREHGFGRGMDAVDILVFDEAQILDIKALEDMVPATNQARNPHGGLVFFIGTPPRPIDNGEAFTAKRRKALTGDPRDMFYVEMSADPDADIDDREQWAKANPSYPHRTPLESMLRMRENIPDDDSWRREALGIWDELGAHEQAIPLDLWNALEVPDVEVPQGAPDRYALTMSPERVASIAVALKGADADYADLAELDRVDDSRKLVDWLVERCGRRVPVMIDSRDPAASFVNDLRARGVQVNVTTASDAGRACGGLLDAVKEGRVWHCGQPAIRAALQVAEKKPVGKAGVWEWNLEDPTPEIAALRAMTLAHYGLSFAKKQRKGARKVVVMS